MSSSHWAWPLAADLASLRAAFPDYQITEDLRRSPPRYAAVARELNTSPWAIVTDSLPQLAEALTGGKPGPPARPSLPRQDQQPAPRTWSRTFRATPDQVSEARRYLTAILGGHPASGDAVTCLSELAANAICHSRSALPGGTFTISFRRSGAAMRIEVTDLGGPWGTRPDGVEHGRGLKIVYAIASRVGITCQGASRDPDQRTIWFELPCA